MLTFVMGYFQQTIALGGFSSSNYGLHTSSKDTGVNAKEQGQNEIYVEQRPLAAEASTSNICSKIGYKEQRKSLLKKSKCPLFIS